MRPVQRPSTGERATKSRSKGERSPSNTNEEATANNSSTPRHPSSRVHRPQTRRASSSPVIELRSRYHDPAITSASLQRELDAQIKQSGLASNPHCQTEEARPTTSGTVTRENFEPTLRWYARVPSHSELSLPIKSAQSKKPGTDAPLKTCLKKKALSTAPTSPGEMQQMREDLSGSRTLRRVKTVDFDEATQPLLALPTRPGKSKKAIHIGDQRPVESDRQANRPTVTSGKPPGLKMLDTVKSSLAKPATTHTDVHVVAIAPSKSPVAREERTGNNRSTDPATPTMQRVASESGTYEIVWDGIPAEDNIRTSRRKSSASHALKAINSTGVRGLLRVNTKLTDWSGSWNAPSDNFKPTIVVFPDEDGQVDPAECSVDEALMVVTPPNSQRTSATASRLPSRPASAPLTRVASRESMPSNNVPKKDSSEDEEDWVSPLEDTLIIPSLPLQSTSYLNADTMTSQLPNVRKLSNLEDTDLKFRGHRDSLTLAHARLMHTGGERSTHRDSISLARKRMHARNHAISAARDIPVMNVTPAPAISMDDTFLDVYAVKEHAAQALRAQKSASMLDKQQGAPDRHIRIVE